MKLSEIQNTFPRQEQYEIHAYVHEKEGVIRGRSESYKALVAAAFEINAYRFEIFKVTGNEFDIEKPENLVRWYDEEGDGIWALQAKTDPQIAAKKFRGGQAHMVMTPMGGYSLNEINKQDTNKMKLAPLVDEKAVSKKQQRFFGMVHAAQKGETPASPEVAKVAKDISAKDAEDFASTKHKGLPEKVPVQEENLWMKNSPMSANNNIEEAPAVANYQIYDDGGKTADRYTLVTSDGDVFGFSIDPFHPQGIGQYSGNHHEWQKDWTPDHLGTPITIDQLPEKAQQYVKQMTEETPLQEFEKVNYGDNTVAQSEKQKANIMRDPVMERRSRHGRFRMSETQYLRLQESLGKEPKNNKYRMTEAQYQMVQETTNGDAQNLQEELDKMLSTMSKMGAKVLLEEGLFTEKPLFAAEGGITQTEGVKYRAEVTGKGEDTWSTNAMEYNTPEEAKQWLDGLSGRWFGYDMSRVVPTTTPRGERVNMQTDVLYQNFRR